MKFIFVILVLIFCTELLAVSLPAVVRDQKFKPRIINVELKDLNSETSFEGKYFKIVEKKNNEAIRFDHPDSDMLLRAATTYYHLTKARNFFVTQLKSDYVTKLPVIVVRLDITNQFSELGHFQHDNLDPKFNNADSVPGGVGLEGRGIQPWDSEIWFRPKKSVHIDEIQIHKSNSDYLKLYSGFRKQLHTMTFQRFLTETLTGRISDGADGAIDKLIRVAGASIVMEILYKFGDPLNKMFSRKWYHLESALVPEIIYHEFSHIALSDHLKISHSTAVIEGMADLFAATIANSSKLATKIKDYNTFKGKKAKNKKLYSSIYESADYANTDFVLGLLWSVKEVLKEKDKMTEAQANLFFFQLRNLIETNSDIKGKLVGAILELCKSQCNQPNASVLRLKKLFSDKKI